MRKAALISIFMFIFLMGCASESADPQLTIFGRMSQLVQLGSTEETVAYKLQTEDYFATIKGEVIMSQVGALNVAVTDSETGSVQENLVVTLNLCQAVDEEIWSAESCTEFDGPLHKHQLPTTFTDGVYQTAEFEWDRPGQWMGTLTIMSPDTGETQSTIIGTEVYPQRPASTNVFELVSISLPFVVIMIFLGLLLAVKGQLIRPAQLC